MKTVAAALCAATFLIAESASAYCTVRGGLPYAIYQRKGGEIPVYVAYSGGHADNDLVAGSGLKSDGTDGVGPIGIGVLEYAIQAAIDEYNSISLDVRLTWGGRITIPDGDVFASSYPHPGTVGIVFYSPLLTNTNGNGGWYTPDEYGFTTGTSGTTGYIGFHPSRPWQMDPFDYDFQGVALHEMGHALGLEHTHEACDFEYYWQPFTDLAVDPASVMNYNYTGSGMGMRQLRRDDIQGLRIVWGQNQRPTQVWQSVTPASGAWSSIAGPAAGATPLSASSSETSSPIDHVIANAYGSGDGVRVWNKPAGTGAWTGVYVNSATARTWSRPGVAQKGTQTMVAWVDERTKDYEVPIIIATRPTATGSWTITTTDVLVSNPQIGLGYDATSDSYILTYIEVLDFDNVPTNVARVKRYDTNRNLLDGAVISQLVVSTIGSTVCVSGQCLTPVTRSHETASGYFSLIHGYVSGGQYTGDSDENTGYWSRSDVDAGVGQSNYFTVTFSQGGYTRFVGRKDTLAGAIGNFQGFATKGWPIGLGSQRYDEDGVSPFIYWRYHRAYFPQP